jgi:hypothetical protein
MTTSHADAGEPALLRLMKDLVDALGTLLAGHVRLARAELGDDARRYARRGVVLAVVAAIALLGYGLSCVAAALALARVGLGAPLAFLVVGGANMLGAASALGIFFGRTRPRPLDESRAALDRTVAALTVSASGARRAGRAPRDGDGSGAEQGELDALTP